MNLKLNESVGKGLKLKIRQLLGLISSFAEVIEEKLIGGGSLFGPLWSFPAILNMVK